MNFPPVVQLDIKTPSLVKGETEGEGVLADCAHFTS